MNSTIFKKIPQLFLVLMVVFIAYSCNKEETDDTTAKTIDLNLSLKSSYSSKSTIYDSINLDIQMISIHTSSDTNVSGGWYELETEAGIYNLLEYVNQDTIIALDPAFNMGHISQIRLLLGDNNTITKEGISFNLETPSAQTSGIKIEVQTDFTPDGIYKIMLDFDPEKSIIETGSGSFKLTPVIKTTIVKL